MAKRTHGWIIGYGFWNIFLRYEQNSSGSNRIWCEIYILFRFFYFSNMNRTHLGVTRFGVKYIYFFNFFIFLIWTELIWEYQDLVWNIYFFSVFFIFLKWLCLIVHFEKLMKLRKRMSFCWNCSKAQVDGTGNKDRLWGCPEYPASCSKKPVLVCLGCCSK